MSDRGNADLEVLGTSSIDRTSLVAFLHKAFPAVKAAFLEEHGSWLYREEEPAVWARNFCALRNGEIVGFGATIPAALSFHGERRNAVWYVDLIVDPQVRRRGVASAIIREIMGLRCWKLGFPRPTSLRALLKADWSCRRDAAVYLLPWKLWGTRKVRKMHRTLRWLSYPVTLGFGWILRSFLKIRIRPGTARAESRVSPRELSEIFYRYENPPITTWRDEGYIFWRFFEYPFADELRYYVSGNPIRVCAVVRVYDDGKAARVLDIFGDLASEPDVSDLLRTICFDLGREGVAQISCLASYPPLQRVLSKTGFLFKIRLPIVFQTASPEFTAALARDPVHFVYADADNDLTFD